MFGKTTADGAMQAVKAILAVRTKIRAAITAAEAELQDAKAGRLRVLGVIAASEAEYALTAEPGAQRSGASELRAAAEREDLASARIVGLKAKLDGTDTAVIEAKAEMETAHGEYALPQIADAVKAYAKLAEGFIAGLLKLSAAAEALGVTHVANELREVRIPDITGRLGYGNLAEQHWSADPKAAAVHEQHAPVADSLRLISMECRQVEDAATAKADFEAKRRQQEVFDARNANGSATVGQVRMPASAKFA